MFKKNTAGQFIHVQGIDTATGGIKSGVSWTVRRCIDGTFAAATGTATEDGTSGWYKFALSQADTNGNNIGFNFTGTGAVPQTVNIVTTVLDPYDGVRAGMTALPNAAANAAGGLPVSAAGGLALDTMNSNVSAIKTKTDYLPSATAGAAGGVFIAGTNAATTITAAAGLNALTLTGGAASGATPAGHGINATGGAASTTGGGTAGVGLRTTGGAGAATTNPSAPGFRTSAGAQNGAGGASGMLAIGIGTDPTFGHGIEAIANGTDGNGLYFQGKGNGDGLGGIGGAGSGAFFMGGGDAPGNFAGLVAQGSGTGPGLTCNGGTGGGRGVMMYGQGNSSDAEGLWISGSAGGGNSDAFRAVGKGTGAGVASFGGETSGPSMLLTYQAANAHGLDIRAAGTGHGIISTGGATGDGIKAVGGATSGDGINASATTEGHGITATAIGTSKHGINASGDGNGSGISSVGNGTGAGMISVGGDTNAAGIYAVAGGTGSGIVADGGIEGELTALTAERDEPGQGTPAANASLVDKIGYLFKAWRNRSTQTASQYSLYADDASTVDQKASFSDNGTTADRGEIATGP